MISKLMGGIYRIISEILLFWHDLWDRIMPSKAVLGTDWQWILAIVFLVVTVRLVLFPIFVKQIKSQRAMQALQPQMKAIQEQYKGDREGMQKAVMALYQKEKVNPLMGCLPMFLQVPVFLGLFHVLRHLKPTMPERLQTLYGWTAEQFQSAANARLFGAPIPAMFRSTPAQLTALDANGTTVKIVAAVLVIIMMTTTFLNSRQMILKTGWSEDPQQRMIQKLMLYGIPVSLLFSGWAFPLGVIIYWVTNNLISLGQQAWVLHKYPPPPMAPGGLGLGSMGGMGSRSASNAAGKAGSGGRPGTGKAAEKPGAGGKVGLGKVGLGKVGLGKAGTGKTNGKAVLGKTDATTGKPVDGKSRAPRPGAKPIRPKKGGATKRPG